MKKFSKISLLLFVLISVLQNSFAQTSIQAGNVSGTWTLANSPYIVQGNIMIPDGQTLVIEAGITIKFNGTYKLLVMGRLLAIGTLSDSITFIPVNTSIGWYGVRFDNTPSTNDSSKIFYCKFQYGKATGAAPYERGGALYIYNFSKLIINKSSISNCVSTNMGAGIYCENSSPIICNNIISNNSSNGGGLPFGGGIYYDNSGPIISGNIISNNSSSRGAGIYSINFMNNGAVVTNNIIKDNITTGQGGGIFCQGADLITFNNIYNNIAGDDGGGIGGSGSSSIIDNNIYNNTAGGDGGGISCWSGSNSSIINNFICNNSALTKGGGIYLESGNTTVNNNIITNNSVTSATGGGGGISCGTGSSNKFSNNTISNNVASNINGHGGALFIENGSSPIFSNCILFGNDAKEGKSVFLNDEPSDPNFYYCDVQGGVADFGLNGNFYLGNYQNNIDTDPLFILPSAGNGTGYNGFTADWSLQAGSNCINSGTPNISGLNLPVTDIAGNPRVLDGCIDIGAYEQLITISQEKSNSFSLNIFPNPTSDRIEISGLNDGIIEIINLQGQIVKSMNTKNTKLAIDISQLAGGVYSIKITTDKGIIVKKLIKK